MSLAEDRRGLLRDYSVSSLLNPARRDVALVHSDRRPLPTGMDPLDRVLGGGFRLHDLVLMGGRPGVGKTILSLQWARAIAQSGATAMIASYEHDEDTMLARLIALEIGLLELGPLDHEGEQIIAALMKGVWADDSPVGRHPHVRAALSRIEQYASKLVLLPASRVRTDIDQLERDVQGLESERVALIVDYVQKVPVPGDRSTWEESGVRIVAERLKELALSTPSTVIAVAAIDEEGLSNRRARLAHLRSAAALSYEADVAILLNDKATCVSRHHLAYDLTRLEEFERQVVFTIEKNRSGRSYIDLEFEKDFGRFRFKPEGNFVAERLVDGIITDE